MGFKNKIKGVKAWKPSYIAILVLLMLSCGPSKLIRKSYPVEEIHPALDGKSPLKLHMKNGDLFILNEWQNKEEDSIIIGYGKHYNHRRQLIRTNIDNEGEVSMKVGLPFGIMIDEIAIAETNNMKKKGGNIAGITIFGGYGAILSFYCMVNPKACFGSCPTFYAYDGEEEFLMAEGFSSSILPSFEKRDIDMLYWAQATDTNIRITVTNEALETHIIRYVNLYAFPLEENQRVFASDKEEFFLVSDISRPETCQAPEGSCLDKVVNMDHRERYSTSDSNDLLTKEYIDIEFVNSGDKEKALLIGSRQSLMTTYLFYQGLAYSGSYAGHFAARIESGDKRLKNRVERIWDMLGQIEVFVMDRRGRWISAGEIDEMGPIASDVHLLKLPKVYGETIKVRLKMTKGLWRIDYLAMAALERQAEPCRLTPYTVLQDSTQDIRTLLILHDSVQPLITYPGDRYELFYDMPEAGQKYELFLETKGYYLEWHREEWRSEADLKKARRMFGFPRRFMQDVAGDFKTIEQNMEQHFWNSRYVKENK